ncbi:MAG: N-acetylmuramoyl-L-alanine amidase [Clostridia bacterium]|nr:N-acetylmuramoyl-L-alanine amidase [Clostridia bacterium]
MTEYPTGKRKKREWKEYAAFVILLAVAGLSFALLHRQPQPAPVPDGGGEVGAGMKEDALVRLPVIVLDPGHGGEDGGAVAPDGTQEKTLNLALSLSLKDLFEAEGYRVVMTRTEDEMPQTPGLDATKKRSDLSARVRTAKEETSPLFLSIHMNKFPQSRYFGLQVYYSPRSAYSFSLASAIQKTAGKGLAPENDREVKNGAGLFLLDRLDCPAVIVECGFLSNPRELELLKTEEYRQTLAAAIFEAVDRFTAESGYGASAQEKA